MICAPVIGREWGTSPRRKSHTGETSATRWTSSSRTLTTRFPFRLTMNKGSLLKIQSLSRPKEVRKIYKTIFVFVTMKYIPRGRSQVRDHPPLPGPSEPRCPILRHLCVLVVGAVGGGQAGQGAVRLAFTKDFRKCNCFRSCELTKVSCNLFLNFLNLKTTLTINPSTGIKQQYAVSIYCEDFFSI